METSLFNLKRFILWSAVSEDASKKIFVTAGILVFDFELFIGGRFDLLSNAGELFTKSDEQGMYTSVGPNRRSSRVIQRQPLKLYASFCYFWPLNFLTNSAVRSIYLYPCSNVASMWLNSASSLNVEMCSQSGLELMAASKVPR